MRKVADTVAALRGWRRAVLAIVAGAVSALAMAPWSFFPVLWVSLPVLIWLIDGTARRDGAARAGGLMAAATIGWSFGFGYFVAGLWWIGAAFFVEADKFIWLMPLAVVGLPAFLALFWGLGAALARLVWFDGWVRILGFAAAFSCVEWLRGNVLTGFPWNAVGYALTPTPLMMQSAALVGLWGLTLVAFVVFAAPALLVADDAGEVPRGSKAFVAGAALILIAHVTFGAFRLAGAPDVAFDGIHVRIVQPAIPQNEKWVEDNADAILIRLFELSDAGFAPTDRRIENFDIVVWPESAFPFYLEERPDVYALLADLLPEATVLLVGAARIESVSPERVFNSVFVIDGVGDVVDVYDKHHLVPFGEYLPFQSTLESFGIRQLTGVPGGFAAGPGPITLPLAGAPSFGPLICYEIIFPGAATEAGNRPGWLLNVTNDAWYGDTPGPRQHFHQARLRAVEEGLPLVRAANTGISAIVDANGVVLASLGVDRLGVVDGLLPEARFDTFYSTYRDVVFWAAVLVILSTTAVKYIFNVRIKYRQK